MEIRAAILLASATLLWMTDFIHHISSAKIGFGIGLAALLPYVGILRVDDLKKVNLSSGLFRRVCARDGQCSDRDQKSRFSHKYRVCMDAAINDGNVFTSTVVLYWTAFVYHIFLSSDIAMLGTSMPMLMNFAKTHSLNPLSLGMIWMFGSAGKIFVYQSAVLIVGYSYGYFRARDLLRIGLLLTLVEFVAILLIVPFYWPMIGIH